MLRLGGSTTCELLLCAHILSQEWFRSVCAIIVCYVSRCRVPSCRVVSSRARSSPGRAMAVRLPLSVFLCSFPFLGPGHRGCEEGSKTLDRNQTETTPPQAKVLKLSTIWGIGLGGLLLLLTQLSPLKSFTRIMSFGF